MISFFIAETLDRGATVALMAEKQEEMEREERFLRGIMDDDEDQLRATRSDSSFRDR